MREKTARPKFAEKKCTRMHEGMQNARVTMQNSKTTAKLRKKRNKVYKVAKNK